DGSGPGGASARHAGRRGDLDRRRHHVVRLRRGGLLSRVTIAIPTYARVQWLGETIASALGQTYTDLVLEVHDDATPDDSVERVTAQFSDPRLRYIGHAANAGIVGNFTRSLLGATTDYVIQLGDDDVAAPTLVE